MTINTIAKMAGVSPATVSRYLNQGYVSEEKKERIRIVIEQTGYTPSPSAQMLRTGKNHLIGVIVPRINSEPVAEMVEGITRIMTQSGYHILLANTSNQVEKELEFLKVFRNNNVDGVIFMGTLMSKRHLTLMRSYQKPIVLLAQQEEVVPSVYFDDYQAAYLATEILLKRNCHEIAYIGVTLKDRAVGRNRRIGFTDAMTQYHYTLDESRMVETQFDMEDGYRAAQILLERGVSFDGIFCATAEIAFGAMSCLRQNQIIVPDQVKVSAIGNNSLAKLYDPPLTTISLSHRTGGSEAAAMLLELIHEQEPITRSEKMICCLHERKSTLP
ncbi:MAG: LacI family DNA-binding transcriptional regulator [Oscillospiraceae bacterium]|nr:LacI family DNA-binding transcriptional regulator [Oscillospiraceae bacterium]